ncbi:MAG: dienelactone hydrolase family protein [Bacteroidota bacterium]
MKHLLTIFLFICLRSTAHAQLLTDSILVEGHYRTFHYHKPANKKNAAVIFALHGSGGNGKQMVHAAAELEKKATKENFILVYPDGYKTYWNECRKAATTISNIENINEEQFFSKMIGYFHSRYQVNKRRVYAIGFSGGGQMAYKFALTMPTQFAAVTAIVANMPTQENLDCGEMKKPIPVMIINGTADPVNPYAGGEMKSGGLVLGNVRSTDETFRYWAMLDGHKGDTWKELLPDTNSKDDVTIEKYSYTAKGKPPVVLLKVVNGKHEFPKGLDAFTESWEFFKSCGK